MNTVFLDRRSAVRRLAQKLSSYLDHPQAIVLGLPRGGVPVAYEIALHLNLPLDVCLVKKLGLPDYPETAMGAVVEDALIPDYSGNITIVDRNITKNNKIDQLEIQAIAKRVKVELRWRNSCYRHYRPMLKVKGKVVIIVDDGIATGLTMQAAVIALKQHHPQKIIIAIPVAPKKNLKRFEILVDDIACLITPQSLGAVGFWYEDFSQVADREVCDYLCQEGNSF